MDISPVSVTTSSSVTIIEQECFICREGDQEDQEELQHFCDCKGLIVHHQCLLTWIQKTYIYIVKYAEAENKSLQEVENLQEVKMICAYLPLGVSEYSSNILLMSGSLRDMK
ncbi:hypothetical protein XENTR_v90012099mg [Pelobates cultripes]|uniref:RING-CH-type domain-containing protein n=1 Tax=Pelobates cultripes TaxID=61616 RepID=A0AAD1WKH0_PELCU|nr:hypothetical protein XENTR_v90012099mg [Pelobates cultripes]